MDRYVPLRQLGDGTYGSVMLSRCLESGELVAIKKMKRKFYSWEECMNLREVKSLKKLNHANVIKLKEVIRENDQLYFVFEYMKENLYQLMKGRTQLFSESEVRKIMFQILQGLAFIHKHGFFHRDMKPENLLCIGPELVKIADFGLAREIRSRPPYTEYVSTRWYRAPEVLLKSTSYSSPIDQWAVGCIMAELYTLRPLFPGSSEVDTIFKICQVLGTPTKNDWLEGFQLATTMHFHWPKCVPTSLTSLIPNASTEGIQLMHDLLQWDPRKRPAANQALRYPYFHVDQIQSQAPQIQDKLQTPSPQRRPVPPPQVPSLTMPGPSHQPQPPLQKPPRRTSGVALETDRLLHSRFPQIHDNGLQSKFTPETKNSTSSSCSVNPKVGQSRRLGHTPGVVKHEEWVDYEDLAATSISKPSYISSEKCSLGDKSVSRVGNALDFKFSNGRNEGASTTNNMLPMQEPSKTVTAKQHYLKQSRYLPGLSTKKNGAVNTTNDSSGNMWGSSSAPFGGTLPSRGSHGSRGYMPPVYNKDTGSGLGDQRAQLAPINLTHSNYATWKSRRTSSHVGPSFHMSSSPKSTPSIQTRSTPQPVHGRTDWTAKYGHR